MTEDQERLVRTAAIIASRVEPNTTTYDKPQAIARRAIAIAKAIINEVQGR